MLTVEELKEAVPKELKSSVTQSLVDKVNNFPASPEEAEHFRDNLMAYGHVLSTGKYKTEDYISAVIYVSFKLMGHTNQDAYRKTFPQRYKALVKRGADKKEISTYVAGYSKGKLVNTILEQTLVPTWVLNQDVYQEAINKQATLMRTAVSERVQMEAANSLLTHLKKPEKAVIDLNLGVSENSGLAALQDAMREMAAAQRAAIEAGVSTRTVAKQRLSPEIEGEMVDVTPPDAAQPSAAAPADDGQEKK